MEAGNISNSSPPPMAADLERSVVVPWERFENFVGQFTHDVRNGLNAIELQLTFLGEISTDPEAVEEVKRLRNSLSEVTRHLQAVKTLTGPTHPNVLEYPACELFEDLRERLVKRHPGVDEKIVWDIDLPPGATLLVDPDASIVAVLELFANLVRFVGTPIRCTAAVADGFLTFTLQERPSTPLSAPTEQWGREPLLSTRRGAYGLGLFRATRLLESQGGTLRAAYSAPDNLLTTTVTLPLAAS